MQSNSLGTLISFTVAFTAAALLSLGLGVNGAFAGRVPDLTPIVVFVFAVRRPHEFSTTLAFLLGIGADLLYGRVTGVGAGVLIFVAEGARSWGMAQERHTALQDFVAFALIATGHAFLLWALGAIGLTMRAPLMDIFRQTIGCVAVYPIWHLILRYGFRIRRVRSRV